RLCAALAGCAAVAAMFVVLGPAYVRSGLSALLNWSQSAEAASPYKIAVQPGDASVPRGGDLTGHARLEGFASKEVALLMRNAGGEYQRLPLVASADGASFEG